MELPRDRDAEAQVLGALLLEPRLILPVSDVLSPADFGSAHHERIYDAILEVAAHGEVDVVAVARAVPEVDPMEIRDLASGCLVPTNAVQHARRVREAAGLRRLILSSQAAIDQASSRGAKLDDVLSSVERDVYAVAMDRAGGPVTWSKAVSDALDELEHHFQNGAEVTGIPTGLRAIDYRFGGLQRRWLVYIGARPGVGKTALAIQSAVNAAREGYKVMVVSLEMAASELARRTICSIAGVSYTKVRHRQLDDQAWKRFTNATASLAQLPIEIYDDDVDTVPQIATRVRRHKPDLVVVDYVQLLRAPKTRSREEEISEVSRGLKLLARSTHVPFLVPVQLNREPTKREEQRPNLADLRGSGSLEQDGDVVMLLHRNEIATRVEVVTAKNRHGPTGKDTLGWDGETTKFFDV